jgi:hypothetical protein
MGYTITKGSYQNFSEYIVLYKFQCGLPWWHDKYPDDIRPHATSLETCLMLPYTQRPLWGLSGVDGR